MNQREAPLFPPVKLFCLQIFEQEHAEGANWRDFQTDHWLSFQFYSSPGIEPPQQLLVSREAIFAPTPSFEIVEIDPS